MEDEVIEETTKVNKVRIMRLREVHHPTQCGGFISLQEEYPSILVRDERMSMVIVKYRGEHHEESIDNDTNEFMDVDVPRGA